MADDVKVNFTTERNDVPDSFRDINSSADSASASVEKTGTVLGGLKGAALLGAGGAALAIAGIGVAAFNVSLETDNAANQMQASLGLTQEKAEEFAGIAQDVFANNFAGSVTEAAEVVELLARQIDGISEDGNGMQSAAEDAIALKDVFDIDVAQSVDAVDALMSNFGITAEQSFDLIALGAQRGLNSSDDMLDTITEYGTQFSTMGFGAEEFFSIMESGMQEGMLGTDRVADSVKELNLKLLEGGTDAAFAFEQATGHSFEKVRASIASGDEAWADYFPNIIQGINDIEDPLARQEAQVALFGTQAEDLGVKFTNGLTTTIDAFQNAEGATESLNAKYGSFGELVSGVGRRALVAITPITDKLLDMANQAIPHLDNAFKIFEEKFVPAMERLGDMVVWATDLVKNMFSGNEMVDGVTKNSAVLNTLSEWFTVNLPIMKDAVKVITDKMGEFWSNHGATITTVISNTFNVITTVIDTALKVVLDLVTLVLAAITGDWDLFGATLKNIATNIFNGISEIIRLQIESLKTIFSGVFPSITTTVSTGFNAIVTKIKEKTVSIVIFMRSLGTQALDALKENFSFQSFSGMGKNALDGLTSGLESFKSAPLETMKGFGESLADKFKTTLGIQSPSKLFFSFGKNILAGLTGGLGGGDDNQQTSFLDGFTGTFNNKMTNLIPHVQDKASELLDAWQNVFGWSDGIDSSESFMRGLADGYNQKMPALISHTQDLAVDGLLDGWNNVFGYSDGEFSGSQFIQGLTDGINRNVDNLIPHIAALGLRMADVLRRSLQIQSPSKVTEKIAEQFLSPLENMDHRNVLSSSQGIANSLVDPLSGNQSSVHTSDSNNSVTNVNVILQVTGDTVQQAQQAIDEIAFRYNANLVGA